MPKISIIIPCYNQAQYLPETLDSVLAQTFTDWECVIVNDGSQDDTEMIAKQYCTKDSRFIYVFQSNEGLASARNNGIHYSSGEFILPLDSDDKIGPSYIEKALRHFNNYPQTKLVYCKARRFGDIDEPWPLPPYNYNQLIWQNCIFCSAIYKRVDYDKTIGYNPNMKSGLEDWDFWLSLLDAKSEVYQLDEVLFYYRYHGVSMISNTIKDTNQLAIQIYKNHKEIYQPYANNLLLYKMEAISWKEDYDLLKKQFDSCHNSLAYRLGKTILKPFSFLFH